MICVYIYNIIIYEGQESALEPLERLHVTRLHLMIECWGGLALGPFYAETIEATGYNLQEFGTFLCRDDRGDGLQLA